MVRGLELEKLGSMFSSLNAMHVKITGTTNLWYSPPNSMTSRLASVTFKMASKVFIEETDKNFNFITEIPF